MIGQVRTIRQSLDLVTLFLPVTGKSLLVPNVSLAEVVPMGNVTAIDDISNAILGTIQWRDQKIPLVSFEAINDEPFVASGDYLRIAVMNGCNDTDTMPFYAIALRGTPRMMRVVEEEVVQQESTELGIAESMAVVVDGSEGMVPNLDYIEDQILAVFDQLNIKA